jgi:hypothetical protein
VAVITQASCGWTAVSTVSWVSITSGATGSGSGNASYTVAPNLGAARTGTLTIAGHDFTVSQAAVAACSFTISPQSAMVGKDGGNGTVSVTASSATCSWTAQSHVSWITVVGTGSGMGNGSIGYTVAANTGSARAGTVTIAGDTFTVSEAAK